LSLVPKCASQLSRPTVTELMEGAHVLLAQPCPPRAFGRCPEIAGQAADEALAAIVDLDELLAALIAALRFIAFTRHDHRIARQ
jgi:hypothetical protein